MSSHPGGDQRPVLFVTNFTPAFRRPSFAALDRAEDVVFALVGGRVRHGGGTGGEAPELRTAYPSQRAVARLAASGRFRAIVAGLSGRVAPLAAWAGARRAGVPFVLWASLWAHPRTPAHRLSFRAVRHLYRDADAVVTYGPHISAYVRAQGARGPVLEAPQAVDVAFWSVPGTPERHAGFQVLFAGRPEAEKGLAVLLDAWRRSGLAATAGAELVLAGAGTERLPPEEGVRGLGRRSASELRNLYAGSDVVVVPSVPTPAFREPWGLVVNEAFHRGVPVIASDAVGAAAGGLVVPERTGLVVPAGDPGRLSAALERLHADAALRERLGTAAQAAVAAHTPQAWAGGVSAALAAAGAAQKGAG